MTLDQYQLCPCGSGKKIKFCCSKDLLHDLDRLVRMIQGDQRLAALEKIESLLEKHPDRPSLLMMKCELEFALRETDKYRATLARLQSVDPKNPSAVAMRALSSLLGERNLPQAVNDLQDAFELVHDTVSARLYEALMMVAAVFQRSGFPVAAKGHLQLAVALSDAKDEQCAQALMQLNHSRQIPLVLREPLNLYPCPANVTWRIEFEAAMREVYRGRWRSGGRQLAAMASRILDAPAILYNQGVVHAWLGDNANAVKAFRDFARIREVPLDDRIHAMALVELLDHNPSWLLDVVRETYEIEPFETLLERCLSHHRLVPLPIEELEGNEDEPAPRAAYTVCDRPRPAPSLEPRVDEIPEVEGELLLYGKQTDRAARLVVECVSTRLKNVLALCQELVAGGLGQPASHEAVGKQQWLSSEVIRSHAMPEGVAPDAVRRLHEQFVQQGLTERFAITACPEFENMTPAEAAKDSRFKLPLQAMLLNIELSLPSDGNLNPLRAQLGLPEREPVNAATCDCERLPVHRFMLLDVKQLNDEQLLTVYRRAYAVMAVTSLRRIGLEVISRGSLDDRIDKVEAFDILSDVATNTTEALEYLDKARKLATADGESPAAWLIDEMEIRLMRGEFEKFAQLVKEVQSRYIKEPGVAQSMVEVLSRFGLVTPDGRVLIPSRRNAPEAAVPATAGVWTPDAARAEASEAASESKLWIPGMD